MTNDAAAADTHYSIKFNVQLQHSQLDHLHEKVTHQPQRDETALASSICSSTPRTDRGLLIHAKSTPRPKPYRLPT